MQELVDTGKRLIEGYRLLFGVGVTAVALVQIMLTPNLADWAAPWVGSLALMVAVFGVVGMLSGQRERRNVRPWLAWTMGCAGGVASFAIVSWRADVDSALAWPTATLAGIATAVLVGFSETTTEDEQNEANNPPLLLQDRSGLRFLPRADVAAALITLGLAGSTLALHAWQAEAGWHHVARVLTGSLYVILVPGWYLSSLFNGSKLDIIDRCALVVALSLVAVPLGLMWIYFLGGHIDFLTTWALVLALAAAAPVLNRLRTLPSASKGEERQSLLQGLIALWESRSVNEKAIVLSVLFWLVVIGSLAWTVAGPERAPYSLLR
jgi:uncharacterized membrane protein